jgi:intergrase/recombinase
MVNQYYSKDGVAFQLDSRLWKNYGSYLSTMVNKHTASCRLSYSKKYAYVLVGGDAKDILSLSADKRIHVMKSLATLSKYLGCYDKWNAIRQRFQLRWSNGEDLNPFTTILNSRTNYSNMVAWLKNAYSILPKEYGNILIYCTLTGLRPQESIQSLEILHTDTENYLNKDSMTLEHFRYNQFIRRTKKAYVSIVSEKILEIARNSGSHSYNAIRLTARRNNVEMRMSYCRKIFATYLRMNGIEPEIIDMLQGRIPKSIFARHYFRPDSNYDAVRRILNSLIEDIS